MTQATKLRLIVIERLGSKCVECGETNIGALELHHPNNDGAQHRKEKSQYQILKELASGVDLERIQILCANCHRKKTSEYNALLLKRNSYIAMKTRETLERILKEKQTEKQNHVKRYPDVEVATQELTLEEINQTRKSLGLPLL